MIGYSLGARLAWALAATGRVGRLVLGGLAPADPIAGVDVELAGAVARGDAQAPDPQIEALAAWVSLPWLELDQALLLLRALSAEPFDPGVDIPRTPTLIVAGAEDDRFDEIAATLADAAYLTVPGDHFGALMSPEFRAAAIGFLGSVRPIQ